MQSALIVLIVLGVVFLFMWVGRSKSNFVFSNADYQYSNPNVGREYDYYKCISDECKGNTHDYFCLEKCHLKAYRKGMMQGDIKDMVCSPYRNDEHAYYRCLDAVYANYRYP